MPTPIPIEQRRIHIWVTGRVQGVGFRAFVIDVAEQLMLTGWVRNVGHETVEAVAEGSTERLSKFAEKVHTGPRVGRVDDARIEWEDPSGEFTDFHIRNSG
jgi:acylphosphatase